MTILLFIWWIFVGICSMTSIMIGMISLFIVIRDKDTFPAILVFISGTLSGIMGVLYCIDQLEKLLK